MLGLSIYYFFNPSFLKCCTFSATLSAVSSVHAILRENCLDCIFSYAVLNYAWRRKKEKETEMELCISASVSFIWKEKSVPSRMDVLLHLKKHD
jgi:hypothetical protein